MEKLAKIPRSVAIIMDGNGRWAQARGLDRAEGHIQGVESVRMAIKSAIRCGVECLTLYAFSTENWGRPDSEVEALMELLARCITAEVPELQQNGVRMLFIGDRAKFSCEMQQKMASAEERTALGERLTLQVALNYSSRDEIRRAVTQIATRVASGEIEAAHITEQMISDALDTATMPDPDLIIRTSGESRLSNFMMWQASYAEFYFPEVLWPDFGAEEFDEAMRVYGQRDRRFGVINENEK
ncbi:MAG: polyprenyl diphosphate synthase [Rikenellaceae bacterium]